jgi:hypothetical protein
MDIRRLTRRIRLGDLVYGLVGALLMGVNCYIAAIIYPQMSGFVFMIVIALGFLGFLFREHSRHDDFAISRCCVTEEPGIWVVK